MEKLEPFIRIVELILAVVASAIVTRILTIRQRVRQETSAADKAETEVKKDQIENIESIVEKVYKPTIETLTNQVNELREEVRQVREENRKLKDENEQLRDAIREISPELVPSRRSVNAQNQPRTPDGKFTKKEEPSDED